MPVISSAPLQVNRPGSPPHIGVNWRAILSLYQRVGCDARAAQINDALAVLDRLDADTSVLNVELQRTIDAATYSVIDGTATVLDAAVAVHQGEQLAAAAGAVPRLVERVHAVVGSILARSFWEAGDALLAELDRVLQSAVAVIVEAGAHLDGADSDAAAVRGTTAQQQAWATLLREQQRIIDVHHLAGELRIVGLTADLPEAHPNDWQWRHPELLDQVRRDEHELITLLRNIAAGAQPAVMTADGIVTALDEYLAQRKAG